MKFDKNGKLIPQKINQESLIDFIYNDYLKSHKYASKNMTSSVYISRFYPNKPNNYKKIQSAVKRKISDFFIILKNLGIVSQFNTTTIRVDFEKLKEFSLSDILSHSLKKPDKNHF